MRIDFLILLTFVFLNSIGIFSNLSSLSTLVGFLLISSLVLIKIKNNENLFFPKDIPFYLFIFISITSFLLNEINPNNLIKLLSLLQLITLAIVISNILNTKNKILAIYLTILFAILVLSFIIIIEQSNSIERMFTYEKLGRISIHGVSINHLSYILTCAFVISSGMIQLIKSFDKRLLLFLNSLIIFYVILLASSLTAMIAIGAYFFNIALIKFKFRIIPIFLLICLLISVLYLSFKNYQLILPDNLSNRIEFSIDRFSKEEIEATGFNKAFSSRGSIWQAGISLASEGLFFGHGFNSYKELLIEHTPNDWSFEKGWSSKDAHNIYLDILLSTGIFSLIVFSLFIFKLTYNSIKNSIRDYKQINSYYFIQSNLLIVSLVFGLTNSIIWFKLFWILIGISIALFFVNNNKESLTKIKSNNRR